MSQSISKYIFLCLLYASLLVSHPVAAATLKPDDARQLIKTTADKVISYAKANRAALKEDPTELYVTVNEIISPHIDFPRVARWILGKHWRKASAEQRITFENEFRKLLIKTYATALLKISNEKITYPAIKGAVKKGKLNVKSEITLPDGRRFTVQYRMHSKDQSWKVYDISVDGVSLVSTYRSSFAAEIRKVGLDGLLNNLATKNKGFNI